MAKFAPQFIVAMVLLMGLTVQAVPLSFSNMLSPGTDLLVHCRKDGQDALTKTLSPGQQTDSSIPDGFSGTYICDFSAAGRHTTTFDVFNSRCNCNTYYGCAWVAQNDGFYCDFGLVFGWA